MILAVSSIIEVGKNMWTGERSMLSSEELLADSIVGRWP